MNSLKREIQKYEEVVVDKKYLRSSRQSIGQRIFIARDGFGMSDVTIGSAIIGYWKDDPDSTARIEGYMLNRKETEKHQKSIANSGEQNAEN